MSEKKEKKESVQISSEEDRGVLNEIEMLDVEENLKKYDSESVLTENKGIMARIVTVVALILSIYQLYLASPWGTVPSAKARAIHLGFVTALIFLNVPIYKRKDGRLINFVPWNLLCAVLALACNIYLYGRIDPLAAIRQTSSYVSSSSC